MKIYTKTGDNGTTALYGGKRVSKYHLRIEAYGTIDELNSFLGLLRDQAIAPAHQHFLTNIQSNLFTVGAIMATPNADDSKKNGEKKLNIERITPDHIQELEDTIDALDNKLTPMTHFVLPGGHPAVSYCHVCRTVCRRAERIANHLNDDVELDQLVLVYLNRLSDYLFVLARMLTKELAVKETTWVPKKLK